jgi:PKD repeat protein
MLIYYSIGNIERVSTYIKDNGMRFLLLIVSVMMVGLLSTIMGCSGSGVTTPTHAPPQSSCHADFSAEPTELDGPATVRFNDKSTGEITGWAWDFNDNGTIDSTEQNPSYFYDENGTYSVTLTVTGSGCENSITKDDYIQVTGCKH